MWKKVCLCQVLTLAIFALDTLGFKINKPLSKEQIYIDVLKNITHVNNILNDLLGNYKQLKEKYEAQAKPENELSVEIEIDNENEHKESKTNYDNNPEYSSVTQMILLDDEFVEESSDKSNENVEVKGNLEPQFPDNVKQESINEKISDSKTKAKSKKQNVDLTRTDVVIQNESPINLSNQPELMIIGTALRYSQNMPNAEKEVNKIINDVSSVSSIQSLNSNKPILRSSYDNIDKLNKNEYRSNDLEQHQEIGKKDFENLNNKTVLLFIINGEQKDLVFKNSRHETDSEKGEGEMLRKEQLESKILRDAYGSACLKVAIRKCYKTLMQVRKLICTMDFHCKDSFKEHFKSHSKTGCITEFNYRGSNGDKEKPSKYNKMKWRGRNDEIRSYHDTTRGGSNINYYELCLPVMTSEDTNSYNKTMEKNRQRDVNRTESINVLRDRYEKECKRLSIEKCDRACNYAVANTCVQSTCERHDKKSFTRTCRMECKQAFDWERSEETDEDNDTDDSDSDENDDSDGDSISLGK